MRATVLTQRFLMCFIVFAAWSPVSLEAQAADYISVKRPLDKIKRIDLKQVYPQFADRWRQVFPLPTTRALLSLWIDRDRRVWFVGAAGSVISVDLDKLDARSGAPPWRVWDLGSQTRDCLFESIWGDREGNIFVSHPGRGAVYHFDGKHWQMHFGPDGWLCGLGPKQVYAVQQCGNIHRFDGHAWKQIAKDSGSEYFFDAWLSPTGTLFACGRDGVSRFNRTQWKAIYDSSREREHVLKIHGLSDSEMYASVRDVLSVERKDTLLHFDGKQWKPFPVKADEIWDVMATRDGPVVASGDGILCYDAPNRRWDRRRWFPGSIWAVRRHLHQGKWRYWVANEWGDLGWASIWRSDATSLSWGAGHKIRDMAFAADGTWYAVGTKGLILRGSASEIERVELDIPLPEAKTRAERNTAEVPDESKRPRPLPTPVLQKWGSDDRTPAAEVDPKQVEFHGLRVIASDDIYVWGEKSTVVHFDGKTWSFVGRPGTHVIRATSGGPLSRSQPCTVSIKDILVRGPNDIFAAGSPCAVLHFDGEHWREVGIPTLFQTWSASGFHRVAPPEPVTFTSIWQSKGVVYVRCELGVVALDGLNTLRCEMPAPPGKVVRGPDGACYGMIDGRLWRLDDGKWTPWLPIERWNKWSDAWTVAADGSVYVSRSGTLKKYAEGKWIDMGRSYGHREMGDAEILRIGPQAQVLAADDQRRAIFYRPSRRDSLAYRNAKNDSQQSITAEHE